MSCRCKTNFFSNVCFYNLVPKYFFSSETWKFLFNWKFYYLDFLLFSSVHVGNLDLTNYKKKIHALLQKDQKTWFYAFKACFISMTTKMKSNQGPSRPITFYSHLNFSLIFWVLVSSEFLQMFQEVLTVSDLLQSILASLPSHSKPDAEQAITAAEKNREKKTSCPCKYGNRLSQLSTGMSIAYYSIAYRGYAIRA